MGGGGECAGIPSGEKQAGGGGGGGGVIVQVQTIALCTAYAHIM